MTPSTYPPPAADRAAFLKERKLGVGGSTAAAILSDKIETDYACKRRAWYELSGIEPDHKDRFTEVMAVGVAGERFVARAYANKTGREVEEVGLKKHGKFASMQVHADRLIHPHSRDHRSADGVLEIKLIGREMMQRVNERGLPAEYLIQLNHGMACFDMKWGEFALGTRDDILPLMAIELSAIVNGEPVPPMRDPKVVNFEMEANAEIIDALEREIPAFWSTLGDEGRAPDRLEPDDQKCASCQFNIKCQGKALMESVLPEGNPKKPPLLPSIYPLIKELRERNELVVAAQNLEDETKAKIKEALGDRAAVSVEIEGQRKNLIYRIRKGANYLQADRIVPAYTLLRNEAIKAGLPGAELTPATGECYDQGMPTRPLLTQYVLPPKEKKGPVPEQDNSQGAE